jgi:class 3 adenylate cyclase/Ca2+-binding EF-hand superfamily protein
MDTTPLPEASRPLGRRSLAAIMFTDVIDSSRLMGDNEDQMMALLKRDLQLIVDLCQQFEGRVLKSMGDGCLAIFDSGVHAVECAQEIQKYFAEQTRTLPKEEILQHRIGIHLGDVYLTDDDAMGDGVNVAARLQSEAPPGGICISQALYEVVKTRLALQTVYQGPKQLKNIKEAVHLYQLSVSGEEVQPSAAPLTPEPPQKAKQKRKGPHWGVIVFIVIGVLIIALLTIRTIRERRADRESQQETGTPTPSVSQELPEREPAQMQEAFQIFQRLDRNNDRQLTQDEIPEQARDRILQADINQDGIITEAELKAAFVQQMRPLQIFHLLDRNEDKQLTQDEIPEQYRDRVMQVDTNQDGVVDEAEIRNAGR